MLPLEDAAARRASPTVARGTYEQGSTSQRNAGLRGPFTLLFLDQAPPAAVSTADPMAIYYANTLEVTQPSGEVDRMQIDPGGRYVMFGVKYPKVGGTWSNDARGFCIVPEDPPETRGKPFCMPLKAKAVGDAWTWEFSGVAGGFRLEAGR